MTDVFDLIVIGAGPAGMAAATTAAACGASVTLLDENASPGGQIYRAITTTPVRKRRILGGAYWVGENWTVRLKRSTVKYVPRTEIWMLRAEGNEIEVGVRDATGARLLRARQVVVATGAMERPMPVPGWTLPGVMTVGAAQTMLKASGMVPEGETVIAGSGPLLYLYARQLLAAGCRPALILDTTPPSNWRRAAWHLPAFVASRYFLKGLSLLGAVLRKVPIERHVRMLRAEGGDRLREIVWQSPTGEQRRKVDVLLLHQGVVPAINLWSAAGCRSVWNDDQACWHAEADSWGQSSVPGIIVAGDGAGVAGAEIAAVRGALAGLQAAHLCRRIDEGMRDGQARGLQMALSRFLRGRDFIDALYRPADWVRTPTGDTIVCRCEEITAAQIVEAGRAGCPGPSQLKAYLRCGMGPCQGRQCGLAVTELLSKVLERSPGDIGHFRYRPPVKPLTVGELASVPASVEDEASVVRL